MKLLERDFDAPRALFLARLPVQNLLLSYGLDRCASWILPIAIVLSAYRLSGSIAVVALVLLAYVLARTSFTWLAPTGIASHSTMILTSMVTRLVATASLAFFTRSSDLWWVFFAYGMIAGTTGVIDRSYQMTLPLIGTRRDLPQINRLVGWLERLTAFVGPLLAGALLILFDERIAIGVALLLMFVSAILGGRLLSNAVSPESVVARTRPVPIRAWYRLRPHRKLRTVAVGLLFVAAIGVLVRVVLVDVVIEQLEYTGGYYGLLTALIGAGALLGPIPVDKLLGHLSVETVFAGGVIALSAGALVVGTSGHVILIAPVLLACGILVVTLDLVASVTLRRLVPEDELTSIDAVLLRAVVGGQIVALGLVIASSTLWSLGAAVVLVSGLSIVVTTGLFVLGGGFVPLAQILASSRRKLAARREISG